MIEKRRILTKEKLTTAKKKKKTGNLSCRSQNNCILKLNKQTDKEVNYIALLCIANNANKGASS